MVVVSSTFSAPSEGIILQQPSTKLLVNDQELGTGTLFITESDVIWGGGVRPTGTPAPTLSLQYRTISLHALQRQPSPSLYLVLDFDLKLPELNTAESTEENEDAEYDPDDSPITQLRFLPPSENDLPAMYSAMSQGQSLHPDPSDEIDEEDFYMDGEEYEDGEEQFEDAEESVAQSDDATAAIRQLRIEKSNGHHEDGNEEELTED